MMQKGKYTTEESKAALAMTVEEIEAMENDPDREILPPLGKYGNLFWTYMLENHPGRQGYLLAETTFREICMEVDREAREMMETVQNQIRSKTPKPPKGDFMAAVQYNTSIRDQAEEIVLAEIVYKMR